MNIWKRNAVVATVVLFVCVALYLSWSYSRTEESLEDGETVYTALGTSDTSELSDVPDVSYEGENTVGTAAIPTPTPSQNTSGSTYFTEQRLSRQKARDSALSILRDLADTLGEEERKQANTEISGLAAQAMTEATVEGLVISKGFEDCVVYISETGVNVIVASPVDGLTATDVVKIQDIVVAETSFTPVDIRIVEAAAG